jgi:hypothetical protein
LRVQATNSPGRLEVTCDGAGVVGHAGVALLGELADRLGLTTALSWRAGRGQTRRHRHAAGRVLRDVVVLLADGRTAFPTSQSCATSRSCSARSPPPPPPGGWWSRSPVTGWAWPGCGRRAPRPAHGPGKPARTPTGCCWSMWTAPCCRRTRTSRAPPAPTRAASVLPAAGVLGPRGWHRRGPGRGVAAGQRRLQHRQRPRRGGRPGAAAQRHARPAGGGAGRHRRRHPRADRPPAPAWRAVLDQPARR